MSGRARDNRLVHFTGGAGVDAARPGDFATVEVTYAAPHHLVSDAEVRAVRRTRAGDAWAARTERRRPVVRLGLPTVGPPAHDHAAPACGQPA
jgi:tRNA-2-methylthio-N6-dimethylallyladenosine synthase